MLPDRVSNPGPLTYESGALLIALRGSAMASFVLSLFPLDVLDGIWDLIESVSEGFLTYSHTKHLCEVILKSV